MLRRSCDFELAWHRHEDVGHCKIYRDAFGSCDMTAGVMDAPTGVPPASWQLRIEGVQQEGMEPLTAAYAGDCCSK